ncbi:hypothetical protein HAHE_37210 [Haloferula helveola]|uniref:Sulfatase N-terminal domain-containing protein n=1 Tax=Haloferula helveola TaxID=490095 RepID=A0ABN6H9H5_9BACT|nr:hypothetical protein HAHE_37210 [Haloferula helveola]
MRLIHPLLIPLLAALFVSACGKPKDGTETVKAGSDSGPEAVAGSKRPNILFLITDDQFKQHMNWMPEGRQANGKFRNFTPNTDRLADHATVFDRQYVTSPVCTPSRFAVLTGMYPSRSMAGVFLDRQRELGGQTSVEWNTFITEGMPTLPKLLRDAGYRTGIVGKNHVVEVNGMDKPEWLAKADDPAMLKVLRENYDKQLDAIHEAGFEFGASLYYDNPDFIGVKALASHNLDWIAKGALDFLDEKDERPFFLYCAVTIPHGPGEPERSYKADPRITALGMLDEPLDVLPPRETLEPRLEEAGVPAKWGRPNLLWLDDMVGALVTKLEETGQLENTIIVYFNDHGQEAKGTIYEGGVHSEGFISHNGPFPVGKRTDALVSNLDFAPTLLELADVSPGDARFDGESIVPVLKGDKEQVHESLFFELGFVRGVIQGDWKYIALRYPEPVAGMSVEKRQQVLDRFNENQKRRGRPVYTENPRTPFSHVQAIPGGGDAEHMSIGKYPAFYDQDQLYNLAEDPKEQRNLAGDSRYAAKLDELKMALQAHLKEMPGPFGDLKPE